MKVQGKTVEISFDYVGSGLVAKGDTLKGFTLCGEDKKFYPAAAEIVGDRVRVQSPQVERPCGVRYAWADDPAGANLYNKEGLPASPFEAFTADAAG